MRRAGVCRNLPTRISRRTYIDLAPCVTRQTGAWTSPRSPISRSAGESGIASDNSRYQERSSFVRIVRQPDGALMRDAERPVTLASKAFRLVAGAKDVWRPTTPRLTVVGWTRYTGLLLQLGVRGLGLPKK